MGGDQSNAVKHDQSQVISDQINPTLLLPCFVMIDLAGTAWHTNLICRMLCTGETFIGTLADSLGCSPVIGYLGKKRNLKRIQHQQQTWCQEPPLAGQPFNRGDSPSVGEKKEHQRHWSPHLKNTSDMLVNPISTEAVSFVVATHADMIANGTLVGESGTSKSGGAPRSMET